MTAAKVDVGRREIAEALVVSAIIVVIDEGFDVRLEIAWQIIVFQQNQFFIV